MATLIKDKNQYVKPEACQTPDKSCKVINYNSDIIETSGNFQVLSQHRIDCVQLI